MIKLPPRVLARGFTITEMVVVVAVVAVLLTLVAPSMSRLIETRRLRGVQDQVLTDIQFTRSEAVSRQERTAISFGSNTTLTCYIVHTCGTEPGDSCRCDCTAAANEGSANGRCDSALTMREVKTVQIPRSSGVMLQPARIGTASSVSDRFLIDPTSGAMLAFRPPLVVDPSPPPPNEFWAETTLGSGEDRVMLRTKVNALGRAESCLMTGAISGVAPC